MSTYQYHALRNRRNTRLLWLDPASNLSSPLVCQLTEVSLDTKPRYDALSYSWESHQGFESIHCSNQILQVTRNCASALRHLRNQSQPRTLWVDAICIDQASIPEKNLQIPNMRDIYAGAQEVLLWVGEGNRSSDLALTNMATISREVSLGQGPTYLPLQAGNQDSPLYSNSSSDGILLCCIRPCLGYARKLPSAKRCNVDPNQDQGLYDIFARTVFERMWCVQEVAVAVHVRLVCGKSSLLWEQLLTALEQHERVGQMMIDTDGNIQKFKNRISLQQMLRNTIRPPPGQTYTWPSMSALLDETRRLDATDPRDKVFALDGLFQFMGVPLRIPQPDYQKSVNQVYTEITQAAMSHDQSLEVLYQVTGLHNQHNLPSYVPDYSDANPPASVTHNLYQASGGSHYQWHLTGWLSPEATLSVCGRTIDQFIAVETPIDPIRDNTGQIFSPFDADLECLQALYTFRQWWFMTQGVEKYPTGDSIYDTFARTLMTDPVNQAKGGMDRFLEAFQAWHVSLVACSSTDSFQDANISGSLKKVVDMPNEAHHRRNFGLDYLTSNLALVIATKIAMRKRATTLHYWLMLVLRKKTLFVTSQGWMGIAPMSACAGDTLVLIAGLSVPFLVRRIANNRVRLVAPVYVHGLMKGEKWDANLPLETFEIS